ncbi:hypothetical protein [Acuticoccus yangtzensis]|uniref:hypothetical protein n=2 Tax=Acuticoccus yangtzensis TaxID=1443441 RepID=UPI000A820A9C|nr:hypothetical protein [Acuticoccus yangtzensis]
MNGMIQHFTVLRSDDTALPWADVLDVVGRELLFRNATTLSGETTMHMTVGGTKVRLAQRGERFDVPVDGLAPLRVWEPSAALGAHASIVSIAITPRDASELAALLSMKVGFALTAAIAEVAGDVLALHTLPNDAFLPPDMVVTVLAAFAADEVPHEILVQYAPYHPQNSGLLGTVGMMTKGLLPLTGFELAVAPTARGTEDEAWRLAAEGVRRHIVEGLPLRDGELLATSGGDVLVRLAAEWLIPGVPMAVLIPAGALIEADTLCVKPELCADGTGSLGEGPRRRGLLSRLLGAALRRGAAA